MAEDFAAMEFYPLRDGTLNRTGLWNDVAAFDMTTPGNMFNSRFYIVEYSPIPEPSSAAISLVCIVAVLRLRRLA
jgi:hypothetical protein